MKRAEKHLLYSMYSAILLTAVLLSAGTVFAAPAISRTKLVMAAGKTFDLDVTGTDETVTWSSSRTGTAEVNENGTITAHEAGKTTISARIGDVKLKCKVIVRKPVKSDKVLKKSAGKWKKQYGAKYYVLQDGSMAVGARKIGSTYYVFDEHGALLQPEKKAIVKSGKSKYYVTPEGEAIAGWNIIKKKLYKTNKRGKILTDQNVDGITLSKSGSAKKSSSTTWKKQFIKTVSAVTNDQMTKKEKLKACWNYLVSRRNFRYALKYPKLSEKNWQKKTAYNMLVTKSGNCYSFACAFAAMADTIGYKSYVVCGRVSGSRDHARDGLTRHAWVKISGLHYDPEGQFASWYRGCYGSSGYRIRHTIQKTVRFWE